MTIDVKLGFEKHIEQIYAKARVELLETDNSVSVHHRNIQILANELYKIVNVFSTEIMKNIFPFNENASCNTRTKRKLHSKSIKSVTIGSETLST